MPDEGSPIPADLNLRCMGCGYQLTGLTTRRCPECGEFFDPRQTWLENERATWEYHFENVRTRWDYAEVGYLAVLGLAYLVLALVNVLTLVALPLALLAEMYILWLGTSGRRIRMACWTACVAWGIAMAMWLR